MSELKNSNKVVEETSASDSVIPSLRFPQKLWRIVNECKSGAISWGKNGLTILINYKSFQEQYLNCDISIFKTTNIASFIRQLNLYGFRKVSSHNRDIFHNGCSSHADVHEFLHEHFQFGRLDLLSRVCRKTGIKKGLLQAKQTTKQANVTAKDSQNRLNGLSRLQMCQIALTKALEQATRQYRKEKFWLQLSNKNSSMGTLKPSYKTELLEPNVQIIFQDMNGAEEIQNLPIVNVSNIEDVINSQEKIQWEKAFTLVSDSSGQFSVPY